MRPLAPIFLACFTTTLLADEVTTHHFNASGHHLPAGWPQDHAPRLLVLAEKPLKLQFDGSPPDGPPAVQLHRVSSARKIPLDAPAAESSANGWQWSWTPPKTRGPADYEVIFETEPKRVIRIESRDPEWLKTTLEMLANASWSAEGLSREETTALANHGLRTTKSNAAAKHPAASLQMIPKQGDAARRRVVWDEENPSLLVWRPGPSPGDLEARAPRWWISPAALATDHGLIRFLGLFSEPPLNP